jgi:hypothetical protein
MSMYSSLYLAILYQVISEMKGKLAAREFCATAVHNAICEIQEAGLEVTADEIDRRLGRMASDFKQVMDKSKKSVA